nr:AI-2E family transporter [Stomatobaculum longum]
MINDRNQKYIAWGLTAFAVVAAALFFSFVLEHLGPLALFLGKIVEILMPFIYGAVMAFLMAPTYQALSVFVTKCLRPGGLQGPTEVKMGKRVLVKFRGSSSAKLFTEAERLRKEKNAERIGKMVATFACIIVILAVLTALIAMLIPQLISGVSDLTSNLPKGTNSVSGWIQVLFHGRNPDMEQMVLEGYRQISDSLMQWISADFMPNLNKYLTQMTSGVMRLFVFLKNFFIGLIVMAYGLNMKEALAAQSKRFLFALLPRRVANDTITELRYVKWVFSSFIVGKIIDSVIIGIICYICMSFMRF